MNLPQYRDKAREELKELLDDWMVPRVEKYIDTLLSDFLDEVEKLVPEPKMALSEEVLKSMTAIQHAETVGFNVYRQQTLQAFKTFREGDGK